MTDTSTALSLPDYFDMLEAAPWRTWYYHMSDDNGAYRREKEAYDLLSSHADLSPAHQALFNGFQAHYYSGEAYGTPRAPKPTRPQ